MNKLEKDPFSNNMYFLSFYCSIQRNKRATLLVQPMCCKRSMSKRMVPCPSVKR